MNNLISVKTMSSLEIAKLTGKEHSKVMADIKRVLDEAEIGDAVFRASYKTPQNKELPCYNLPRRECDLVIAGYSVKYRLAIIDRWQELESKQPALPDFTNPVEAARAWANEVEKKQIAQAEINKLNTLLDRELGYCSILRAAQFLGVHETTFKWRVLKSHAVSVGLEVKRVPSPRFEFQNLYPLRSFRECYPDYDFDDLTPELVADKSSLSLFAAKG